jgi:hypothetical protein
MKTLILETNSKSKFDVLVQLAKELNIKLRIIDSDEKDDTVSAMTLSEKSFSKEWDSKEDDRWDDFLKHKK